jgi:hypothetical protein
MPTYVRVENELVVECLEYLPEGASGDWRQAVNIDPVLVPNRQIIGSHHFDLSKNPVEILWSIIDLSVEERKAEILAQLNQKSFNIVYEELIKEFSNQLSNLAYVQSAIDIYREKKAEIESLQTHEDVDAFIAANE